MSTRCNVIVTDGHDRLYFYRHSDGYPEGVQKTLDFLVNALKEGHLRNNVGQFAGWLILVGAMEYKTLSPESFEKDDDYSIRHEFSDRPSMGWKCGAYEPTTGLHGDIEHLYVIDLREQEWREIPRGSWYRYENHAVTIM